jgi:hypothetical protein
LFEGGFLLLEVLAASNQMPERQFAVDLARDRIFPSMDRVTINRHAFINEAPFPEDLEKTFGLSLPALDDFILVDTKAVVCCEFLQLFPGMVAVLLQMYPGLLAEILQNCSTFC